MKITYNILIIESGKSNVAEIKPRDISGCGTPDKCRIQEVSSGMTTCAYYPPIYDEYGNNLNPDRNITRYTMRCTACGKEFTK